MNNEIMPVIIKEVEKYLSNDRKKDSLEIIEDQVRDLMIVLGKHLLQHELEKRIESSNRGYVGNKLISSDDKYATFERYEERKLNSYFGWIRFKRAYYWSPYIKEGIFPMDEELGLNKHAATPSLQRGLTAVGVEAPFSKAERLFEELTRAKSSQSTIAEITENRGLEIRDKRREEVKRAWEVFEGPSCKQAGKNGYKTSGKIDPYKNIEAPKVLYIQMDGGRINTTKGWKEPKVGVFFKGDDVTEVSKDRGEIINKEYVATMSEIEEFQKYIWETGLRWGADKAEKVILLGDGGEGFQKRGEELYPNGLQILDWYHACEHLWDVAKVLYGAGTKKTNKWVKPLLDKIYAGKVEVVIEKLKRMKPRRQEVAKKIKELIGYYEKNKERMRYKEFESKGYFIGSGAVESGVKNVVNMRMKGCGMRWDRDRADRLLHARAKYLSSEIPMFKAA